MTTRAFDTALFVPVPANVNDGVVVSALGPPFTTVFKPMTTGGGGGGAVTSVAGRIGDVVLTHADITDWGVTLAPYALTTALPNASTATPLMDGATAVGVNAAYARGDHVHPTDTSRYAASNPSGFQTAGQVTASLAAYLPLAGGILTGGLNGTGAAFTGNISNGGNLNMTGASPGLHSIFSYNGANATANLRWLIGFANNAESGTATGSDFLLSCYDNTGTFLASPISIARALGGFGSRVLIGGLAAAGAGFQTRAGSSGAYGSNPFNIEWTAGSVANLWIAGTNVGTITVTSDYRIKREVQPLPSMWERAKALRPISYKHQDYTPPGHGADQVDVEARPLIVADDIERWGFIAHELQATLIGDAATGEKDSPLHIQSPNPWTVIATLTKALQEAMTRIEALEMQGKPEALKTEIDALKAAQK